MKLRKSTYAIYFLILFYVVGVIGFILPQTHALFSTLTPFALLLSAGFLAFFHTPGYNVKTLVVFLTIFVVSFFAEVIGVYTGVLFGEYIYGGGLGLKILDTPLMIGLNWLMLVYSTKVIADKITPHPFSRLFAGPLLMVGYDLILEQAAPLLGMWDWAGGTVPVRNYIAWFLLAFLFHFIMRKAKVEFKNPLATAVFSIQFLFFVILVLVFRLDYT